MNGLALLRMVAGLLVWSSGFVALYAVLSLGCTQWPEQLGGNRLGALNGVLALLLALHLAVAAILLQNACRRVRRARADNGNRLFIGAVTALLDATAVVALVWTGLPVVLLPPCL